MCVVLYGCEMWIVTMWEQRILTSYQDKVLLRIERPGKVLAREW